MKMDIRVERTQAPKEKPGKGADLPFGHGLRCRKRLA